MKVLNKFVMLIYLFIVSTIVLSGQTPKTHYYDEAELLTFTPSDNLGYNVLQKGKGPKNITYISTSSDYKPENYIKGPSVTTEPQKQEYIVLYPRVNNSNNINVTPEVITKFDSCQFLELVNNYKDNNNLFNQKREDELLFMITIIEYIEKDIKEQKYKGKSEAIVNLVWFFIFWISVVILRYNNRVKQDRLVQSMIALVLIASLVLFISNLPSMIYYFGV